LGCFPLHPSHALLNFEDFNSLHANLAFFRPRRPSNVERLIVALAWPQALVGGAPSRSQRCYCSSVTRPFILTMIARTISSNVLRQLPFAYLPESCGVGPSSPFC
jgi:hypothetical protein